MESRLYGVVLLIAGTGRSSAGEIVHEALATLGWDPWSDEAGYVGVTKEFVDDKPIPWYALTPPGRKALEAHLSALDGLIRRAVRTG